MCYDTYREKSQKDDHLKPTRHLLCKPALPRAAGGPEVTEMVPGGTSALGEVQGFALKPYAQRELNERRLLW